ncbi:MAG: ribonuclease P protein subunit [Ignisphaera sp.]|uniref:Ribonuclease P protein component 1 n=1 Tax=Ignisphaera aggregans TaxID=334771 RepID=A0A7C4NNL5_9CREN
MPSTKKLIAYHELIGLKIKIASHSDPTLVGKSGVVVDETSNTLIILDEDKNKKIRVPKCYGIYEFELQSKERIIIDGTLLLGRPEDRLKKMLRR